VAAPLPNPFSDGTVIDFSLSRPVRVEARVYDAAGREVATLAAGSRFAEGRHQLFWSGRDAAGHRLPAGVYLCRINTDGAEAGARIVHLR